MARNNFQGYVIDSHKGLVRKFVGHVPEIYEALNCTTFTIVTIDINGQKWDLYLDDEGMYNHPHHGIKLRHGDGMFFGNGVLLGYNPEDGSTRSCKIGPHAVNEAFTFWYDLHESI